MQKTQPTNNQGELMKTNQLTVQAYQNEKPSKAKTILLTLVFIFLFILALSFNTNTAADELLISTQQAPLNNTHRGDK